ncbi:Protein kes1 [Ceratocystis lukuohia]|uniref:Protein kes1 n=2 Tax=Ceratocystis TaxID=5157 RepID=A0A0F8BKQ5_CERFI|nr:Protein kes1 [Ceratocystis platani]
MSEGGANSSSWSSFLKSIASFNGDLSSLTAPPFILSGTSLTEFSQYWCCHPSLFVAAANEPEPAKRATLVLKWFLSTLKQQYASRSEKYGNEKKPLNPFLGEVFLGKWQEEATGTTELISEQVSHHPPATAYCVTNLPTGVRLQGYNAQKATFSSTIYIKQIGHAVLTLPASPNGPREPETYLITLPSLHIEGLIMGAPFLELESSSYITSSSGFTAKLDYSGRGWLSGKKNSVTATLYQTGNEKAIVCNATGVWTKSFELYSGPPKTNSAKTLIDKFDAATFAVTPLTVADIEDQDCLESRRAWSKVANAISSGNLDKVGSEKAKIEQAQRQLRSKEKEQGRTWERRYFTACQGQDPVLAKLAGIVGLPLDGDTDKTGGVWRFDDAKQEAVKARKLTPEEAKAIQAEVLGQ